MGDNHTLETASVGSIKIKIFDGIFALFRRYCMSKV